MSRTIQFTVDAHPEPAGSKRAFPLKRKDGSLGVRVTDANKNVKQWQQLVKGVARANYDGPLLQNGVYVAMKFVVLRPKGHFGSGKNAGKLKKSAPWRPVVKPDVLKLARGVEDALTGVIWRDDSQIVNEYLTKEYGDWQGVVVRISEAPFVTYGEYQEVNDDPPANPPDGR